MMDATVTMLGIALQYGYARQSVIAHNIANSNTPGFKTFDLLSNFDLYSSDIKSSTPNFELFKVPYTGVTNLDGNNVNIELESMKSMYTTLYTQTILDFIRAKFDGLKIAITERIV